MNIYIAFSPEARPILRTWSSGLWKDSASAERHCWAPVARNSPCHVTTRQFLLFRSAFRWKSMHMAGKVMWGMPLSERVAWPRCDIKERWRSYPWFFLRMKRLWGHKVTHSPITLGKLTKPDWPWDHTAAGLSAILTARKIWIDPWMIDYVCPIVIASSHKMIQ